jgi:hypothetical protein
LTRIVVKIAIAAFSTTCDNTGMAPFDDIEIRRPAIAQAYLALLDRPARQAAGPVRPETGRQDVLSRP